MSKVAAIQMCSSQNVAENLQVAANLIDQATQTGAKLVVLPEMFAIMTTQPETKVAVSEIFGRGIIQDFLAEQAKKNQVWIVGGTIPVLSTDTQRARAACLVYDNHGTVVTRYDKIHLFDAQLSQTEVYRESASTEPGNAITVINTPFGKLGLAVCYDIRFPELFRAMALQGMEILAIPTAFTVKTGQAHWQLLTRARAVENFCYVIGACQVGTHSNGRQTYGHSVIVEPWGEIIACLAEGVGYIIAEIDLEYLRQIRATIPALQHRRMA